MFEKIKYYFEIGLYKDKHIDMLLSAGAITQEEYEILKGDVNNVECDEERN